MFPGEVQNLLEKSTINHLCGGIVWKGNDQELRLRPYQLDALLHLIEEVPSRQHGNAVNIAARD
jgi:hypothetical protein